MTACNHAAMPKKPIRTTIARPVRMTPISVSAAEQKELREAAQRAGVAVAAFVRDAALEKARRQK